MHAEGALVGKVLAVVAQNVIAVLPQCRGSGGDNFLRPAQQAPFPAAVNPHLRQAAAQKFGDVRFLHLHVRGMRLRSAVEMDDHPVTGIDAVVIIAGALHAELIAGLRLAVVPMLFKICR